MWSASLTARRQATCHFRGPRGSTSSSTSGPPRCSASRFHHLSSWVPMRSLIEAGQMPLFTAQRFRSDVKGTCMAKRGSAGLLLGAALLLGTPALATTPADRSECAASADKPELGSTACSRIIDDAAAPVEERANAYNNRGIAAYGLREYDAALADHSEAIKLNPEDPLAHARRGMAWTEKGGYDEAIADLTRAV